VYDPSNDSWSVFNQGPTGCRADYMAAVTVLDKLCVIAKDNTTGKATIYWTKDLATWNHFQTDITCGTKSYYTMGTYDCHISAIPKSWMDNGTLNTKIMIAYIPSDLSVRVAEYAFDDQESLYQISDVTAANDLTYTSAVLAEGTVSQDQETGICTQLFVKKATKDNGYCRYRLLRYQKTEGGNWTLHENNLVKQNYLWADKDLDLTAANFPSIKVRATDTIINQLMCLVYRGYDDWDHPLNCAWATTDQLKFRSTSSKVLTDQSYLQYVGYIEGAPPFYVNTPSDPLHPYVNTEAAPISEIEYQNSVSTGHEAELAFDVERSVEAKVAGFSANFATLTRTLKSHETKVSTTTSYTIKAGPTGYGYYLCLAPYIYRDRYDVFDWKGLLLYSTYDFYLMQAWHNTSVPLTHGFVYGNLESYMDSITDFNSYHQFPTANVSWLPGVSASESVSVDNSQTLTNTKGGSLELGIDMGEFLNISTKGSFDFSLTTTTVSSNEITCTTDLNEPDSSSDVVQVDYQIFWLLQTNGMPNWWLDNVSQDPGQNTWCVTYQVYFIVYNNGDTVQIENKKYGTGINDNKVQGTPMIRNRPNPFTSVTTIRYRIDSENQKDGNSPGQFTTLSVYDNRGKLVTVLVNEKKKPGIYEVQWDATALPAGMYFCRLQSGNHTYSCKLVVS